MTTSCPRCAAPWEATGACPSCGFEPEHPGVLASYARGASTLAARPVLLLPFLPPVLLLIGAQLVLPAPEPSPAGTAAAGLGVASLVALLLHLWWLLVAVAVAGDAVLNGPRLRAPQGAAVASSGLAAGAVLVPVALLGLSLNLAPTGAWGAVVGMTGFVLLVLSIVALGRAAGAPVEAACGQRDPRAALVDGNRRARENGGLGFAFLFLMGLVAVVFLQAVVSVAGLVELGTRTWLAVTSTFIWGLEALFGVALVHGLVAGQGVEHTFTCPRCGSQATAQGGRARCGCGLEGPYYRA